MKKCFKCLEEKPLEDFYKHSQMSDGHVNKCKDCNKQDVIKNRLDKVEYYRKYDIERGSRRKTEDTKKYRDDNPNKYKAHNAVNNALRDGKLVKNVCEVCGVSENVHAHHDDYSKVLEIRWLCPEHHSAWHTKYGEALNG